MNVESILQDFRIDYDKKPEYYVVKCPFHNDTNPSGNIHHKTSFYHCFVCGKRTTLIGFLTKHTNLPLYQVKSKVGYRTDLKNPIAPMEVEGYHIEIWNHASYLKELYHRCITDELIRKYRLGVKDLVNEKRITIPIPNDIGEFANLRMYIPGATEKKFLNSTGKDRSRIRLYPIDQLEYDQILICGGELKAIAAAEVLNKYDIGAISPTCGEQTWPSEYNERFANKLIYINLDVDETGERYSEIRCRILNTVARAVHKVVFTPEMVGHLPKGDINDFLRLGGDLYKLLVNSPEWSLVPSGVTLEDTPKSVSFREAYSHDNVGIRLEFTAIVAGINSFAYFAPASVEVKCNRNEEYCTLCDVNSQAMTSQDSLSKYTEMKIGTEHPALLALVGEKTEDHWRLYKQCFKIPHQCRQCTFEPKKQYSITEVKLDEQVEPTSRIEPLIMRKAFIVNSESTVDQESYSVIGRCYPSPKNQASTVLISKIEPTQDSLDSYQPIDISDLNIFQPDEWTCESLEKKIEEIYDDLEANVTKIYQRREYHLAIDLTYHSILHFDFSGNRDINGYVEFLAVGDTGQGKSKAVLQLKNHYGLGFKVDCKNVSLPGLTIGLEKQTFAIYGALPKNDKKLVILEELKGMNPKVFQALTEARSSGYVQLTKISSPMKRARVRIIAISNPPDKREVSSYTYGIQSAVGIIGTHEDLRRFDLVMILGRLDIDPAQLNSTLEHPPVVEHRFSDELCQRLILRAWKCENVVFEDVSYILEVTKKLVALFGDGPPVLDANTSHLKIAKLSAALAARTNSYDERVLIVRRCHVEYIYQFLIKVYSSRSCRLDDASKSIRDSTQLRDKENLISYLKTITNAADVMIKIAETDELDGLFIRELCGELYSGTQLFSKLIQSNAVQRIRGTKYVKTPEFVKLLGTTQFKLEVPGYIEAEKKRGIS